MLGIEGDDTSANWQTLYSKNYDASSQTIDPLFVDAANDDYNLDTNSPAITDGFVTFDQEDIGLRSDYRY